MRTPSTATPSADTPPSAEEAFWGGFWRLQFGSAMFAIPGLGTILVAGLLVAWIVGALEEVAVVGEQSAQEAGLFSIGVRSTAFSSTRSR